MNLSEAVENSGKEVLTYCMVAGKDVGRILVPHIVDVKCFVPTETCVGCKLAKQKEQTLTFPVRPYDVLFFTALPSAKWEKHIRKMLFARPNCPMEVYIHEPLSVIEKVYLTPPTGEASKYTMVEGYYLGSGLEVNMSYKMALTILPYTAQNMATGVIRNVMSAQGELDNFTLSLSDVKYIRDYSAQFGNTVDQWIALYYSELEKYTRIFARFDMHFLVDLCYHTPLQFYYNGELLRGTGDVLLFGDTRTGKGKTAEGIMNFYQLGSIVSGENVTFAGLIGGLESFNGRYILRWGKLPLSNRRLVVIDEASGMVTSKLLPKLSRIRSDGVAEIDKIAVHAKTDARVRIVWISNPVSGRLSEDTQCGITSLQKLIPTQEDIARFDFVGFTAQGEVGGDIINTLHPTGHLLNPVLERKRVLWAWTRTPKEIYYPPNVLQETFQAAQYLSTLFSARIPLVQIESIGSKVARFAIALAMKMFNTTDGKTVTVTSEHVRYIKEFVEQLYSKECCGYKKFSQGSQYETFMGEKA